ncbi:hypothetical protein QL285_091493 [Trifolium repens]|nr:hypothetical protein QL285_091493 [Trifolium repens]
MPTPTPKPQSHHITTSHHKTTTVKTQSGEQNTLSKNRATITSRSAARRHQQPRLSISGEHNNHDVDGPPTHQIRHQQTPPAAPKTPDPPEKHRLRRRRYYHVTTSSELNSREKHNHEPARTPPESRQQLH